MSEKKLISLSIPVYNESDNIGSLYDRISGLADTLAQLYDFEFVFTDNRSEDDTWEKIEALAKKDSRVRGYRFSRNFGFQRSILANYMHTRGAAVVQLDADLQDPPELIKDFLEKWEVGFKVVYGVRRARPESIALRSFRRFGYWVIEKLAGYSIPQNVGDFRLVDRDVIKALASFNDTTPYLRGSIAALGFAQTGIVYDRDARVAGKSKFRLGSLIKLGLDGIFATSTMPLRLATFVGLLLIAVSVIGALYYMALKIANPDIPIGLASTNILILFTLAVNSLFFGLIGEYVIRMHNNIRGGDIAAIDDVVDFSNPSESDAKGKNS